MRFYLILFSILYISSIAAEEIDVCESTLKSSKDVLEIIQNKIKNGQDLGLEFNILEKLNINYSQCDIYKNLKITDNTIASFRKYMHAPDVSFDLNEKDCTELKVDTSNMPKNNNQVDLGWCYAFAATDIISFHEKKKFSAYDVATTHIIQRTDIKPDNQTWAEYGGVAIMALFQSLVSQKGICLEDETNFSNSDWYFMSEFFKTLMDPSQKLPDILCDIQTEKPDALKDLSEDIIHLLDKLSAEKRTAALLDIKCKNRFAVKNQYEINGLSNGLSAKPSVSRKRIIEKADEILSKGEPSIIRYSTDLLHSGVNFLAEKNNHSSTLIGREYNKQSKQCEYLIKNSWGSTCEGARSIRCKDGIYYVPRTTLKNNTDDIIWMNKSN